MEAVDSYFKLISKLKSSRNQNFSEQIKGSTCRDLNLEILKRVMHQLYTSRPTDYFNIINQIMNCLFNEIHNYRVVFSFGTGKIGLYLESSCSFLF